MIARWQRVGSLLALAAAGLWLLWCGQQGWGLGRMAAGVTLALLPHAPVLALEMLLLRTVGRDATVPPPGAVAMLRAWAGEVVTGVMTFGWRQPWAWRSVPDVPGRPGATGVLLLHGYVCNRGLWLPWLRSLQARGVPTVALSMEPVFGRIDDWVPAIDAAVQALTAACGRPPVIVAHSMGGLAARAWLAQALDRPGGGLPLAHLITIGTPHQGTWLARWGQGANARQMRPGGAWLLALAQREAQRRQPVPATCFFSHTDNIVFPASTATLPGADNRHLPGWAHVQLLAAPAIQNALWRVLDKAGQGGQAPTNPDRAAGAGCGWCSS